MSQRTEKETNFLCLNGKKQIEECGKNSLNEYNDVPEEEQDYSQIGEKVKNSKEVPNFIYISNPEKANVHTAFNSMLRMLFPTNRKKAKYDFYQYAISSSEDLQQEFEKVRQGKGAKPGDAGYKSSFKKFTHKYPTIRRESDFYLYWYTEDCFFFKVLNKGLRLLTDPLECYALRLPFSDVFHSIKELYISQQNDDFRKD